MRGIIIVIFALLNTLVCSSQIGWSDWSWWREQHGWESGDPEWRYWLVLSPGKLGPNAIPVPELKRGILEGNAEFEITTSNHFHKGDPTQDISGRAFISFANRKIAVEMYGVLAEYYSYIEKIRNERFSIDKDGEGYVVGDFYFCTLIQLSRDRKFPNTLFRLGIKTASGSGLYAARHTDSPGYFMDFSFSKDIGDSDYWLLRPHAMVGLYVWQTNYQYNFQNDALLYGLGTDLVRGSWRITASWSGYQGYRNDGDRPMQLNFDLRKDFENKAVKVQYQHGLHDWLYKTVRFSFIWKLNIVD